jgi:alcohol dehydrogenase class IV
LTVQFEFATATRILFGSGTLLQLGTIASEFGKRALLVTGRSTARAERAHELLADQAVASTLFQIQSEPTTEDARRGVELARQIDCDVVVAIGGGSALDGGKAIAALATNAGDPLDYLEVIGAGRAITQRSLPCIAIPTTAGTGSEVTRNAVLEAPEHRVKVSLRSYLMLPAVALVDPELSHSMPPAVTASTGFDALSQVLEPFVCNRNNPVTDALCREAMMRAARSLRRAYEVGNDNGAREDMAFTSLCGGIALANAKLGAVHGFAGPLGGMFRSPHGATCAALLPHVMDTNVRALRQREPTSHVLARYDEVARLLTGRSQARAEDGIAWTRELAQALNIPPLSHYGVRDSDVDAVVKKAAVASSMQGNPIKLTSDELSTLLRAAL